MPPLPMLLSGRSAKPGASEIIIVNGDAPSVGYRLMQPNLGNVDWQKFFSGPRGTQGARLAGAEAQNRAVSLQLEVVGTSQDDLHAKIERLWDLDHEWRKFGGALTWRPRNGSYKLLLDVLDSSARLGDYDRNLHLLNRARVELLPVCAPYLKGEPYDIFDGFDTDDGDWTKDVDGAGFSIQGGVLQPSANGTSRLRHTGRGYRYSDQMAQVKFRTGSTVTNFSLDLFICADPGGSESFISARIQGGNISVTKWAGGTPVVGTSQAFTPSANTTYWLRIWREQRRILAAVYGAEPAILGSSALASPSTYTLTIDEAAFYQAGHSGLRVAVVAFAGEQYDDFRVEPFSYQDNLGLPDQRILTGAIPGDAPALGEFSLAQNGASNNPVWALLGWWPRPVPWNWCANGDFEDDVDGWSVAAVLGVTGAATSIAQNATAARNKYGLGNGQVVTPASANVGTTFKIQRRFLPGRFYTLLVWASAASAVTSCRCRLGVSGSIADSPASALTTTPQLYSAQWSPTTNQNGAYACFEQTAATASTFSIDGVCVVEGGFPLFTGLNLTATTAVMYDSADEYPPTPFLAIIDAGTSQQEIVQVDDVGPSYADGSGTMVRNLTIVRGREGTTAAFHVTNDVLVPLPSVRSQLEGKGGQPVHGIIEGESADAGNLFTWTVQADAACRLGNKLYASGIGSLGAAFADWLVDPSLMVPDDFTQGEVAVEVWARLAIHAGLTGPFCVVGAAPESATVSSGAISSPFGGLRYSEEFGAIGRPLVKPSSGEAWRFVRLGQIRLPVDRAKPARWRLFVRYYWTGASSATAGLDYLILVPAQGRALSPTGKADSAANFPRFFNTTAVAVKTIRSDLSGLVQKPGVVPVPDHGLGGSLIELPPGGCEILGKLSSLVPDDPSSNTSTEELSYTSYMHLAVTPRWTFGRGS